MAMNYEFYGDYTSYVAALRNMGFTIETVTTTSCRAYWKNCPESVYIEVYETGTADYSGYKYIAVRFHIGEEVTCIGVSNTRKAYTSTDSYESGNIIYISDAYWDNLSEFPSRDDYLRITINIVKPTDWRHKAVYVNIGDTSVRVEANVIWLPKTYVKNFTNDMTYTVRYEDTDQEIDMMVLMGTIRKSSYKFTKTASATIKPYTSELVDGITTIERIYNNCCLPYVLLDGDGIAMPNLGTLFRYDASSGESIMMNPGATSGLTDYGMIAIIPPSNESTNWVIVHGKGLHSCNSDEIINFSSILTTDPDSAYYPINVINDSLTDKLIAPIIDPYDKNNCGAITNLNYTYGTSFDYLGAFAEYGEDTYYLVKRTTAVDTSRRADPYVYAVKVKEVDE